MAQRIKSITFKGNKTEIKFYSAEQKRGFNEVVEEKNTKVSDLIRHKDFIEAMENMTPHLGLAIGFSDNIDRIDYPMDMDWFQGQHYKDDDRFKNLTLTGVIVTGKDATDGIQLTGTIESPSGDLVKLKTPVISLHKEAEGGYNYRCQVEIDAQWETLDFEAKKFVFEGKTGATAVQTSMNLDKPLPQAPAPNMTIAKKVIASTGVPLTN